MGSRSLQTSKSASQLRSSGTPGAGGMVAGCFHVMWEFQPTLSMIIIFIKDMGL